MIDDQTMFQQDNAKCHVSRDWFSEQGLNVMEWPAVSPDLNPIENLWVYIQRKVYADAVSFTDKRALKKLIMEVWETLPKEIITNLIGSMRKRMS